MFFKVENYEIIFLINKSSIGRVTRTPVKKAIDSIIQTQKDMKTYR